MILSGAMVAAGPGGAERLDVEITGRRIRSLRAGAQGSGELDLRGFLILPGLINSHDHLEFNLFPRIVRGPYPSAGAWARDVYRPEEPPVREHLRVPKSERLLWGALKNLLNGVTTVCHHNPVDHPVFSRRFPVRVVKHVGWAHSLEFTPDTAGRFQRTPAGWPFILHLGEATDGDGREEIFRLDERKALDERTVLVHAVALEGPGLQLVRERGASIVWCPSSNLSMLGRTLLPRSCNGIRMALGTDSALTAEGDLQDELRIAERAGGVTRADLYRMVTDVAAGILRLPLGAGMVRAGGPADLVAVKDRGQTPADSLFELTPDLVICGGKVKLVSRSLAERLPSSVVSHLHPLSVECRGRMLVDANVPRLRARTARVLGPIFLAGKRVLDCT